MDKNVNASLITKKTDKGERYAVQFFRNGRKYVTLFTSFRNEACAWGQIIRETGWCVSARPLPA